MCRIICEYHIFTLLTSKFEVLIDLWHIKCELRFFWGVSQIMWRTENIIFYQNIKFYLFLLRPVNQAVVPRYRVQILENRCTSLGLTGISSKYGRCFAIISWSLSMNLFSDQVLPTPKSIPNWICYVQLMCTVISNIGYR